MKKVGIIGAMKSEMDGIKSKVKDPEIRTISGIDFMAGELCGIPVIVATSGIGKVFAGMCAQTMILEYEPDLIINVGVAGSLSPELNIGDIAVASAVVQHDMDTTGIGDPPGLISGIDMIEIPSSEYAVRGLARAAEDLGFHRISGIIASGDSFIQNADRKKSITENFGAIACEMEGAGVGQVCYVNDVPFCVLRAISDNGDENATSDYGMSIDMAAERASQVMESFLKAFGSTPQP